MLIKKQLLADDGVELTVFHTPLQSESTIVFLNDFGVESRIVQTLAERAVARGVNLVTWNTRGVPGAYRPDFRQYGMERHALDWLTVMDRLRLERVALVGWCGSCQLGLVLAQRYPARVAGVGLVSGYFGLAEPLTKDAGRMMIEMAVSVSASETKAKFFHKVLASSRGQVDIGSRNPSYRALAEAFKASPEALLRWCVMQVKLVGVDVDAMCAGIQCPVWFVAGGADEMIAPADVSPVAERIPQATLTVFPDADHYALFADESVQAEVIARARSWHGAVRGVPSQRSFASAVSP